MTNEDPKGFSLEQMKDIYVKLETSRILAKMAENLAKEIEADIKFYTAINNDL